MKPAQLLDALKTFKAASPIERELITLCQFWIMQGDQEPQLLARLQRDLDRKNVARFIPRARKKVKK